MNIDSLYPIAGNHAIQSVVAVVSWGSQDGINNWNADAIQNLQTALAPIFRDLQLPHQESLMHVAIQYAAGFSNPQTVQGVGGFKFTRQSKGSINVLRSVVFTKEQLVIEISDYTRWADFIFDTNKYIESVFKSLPERVSIKGVTLQFNDVFLWKASPEKLVLSDIFQADTNWLPKNIFTESGFWHSHHGYITDSTDPFNLKKIDNINVSRSERDGNHIIQILTAHQSEFKNPIWIDPSCVVIKDFDLIFQKSHIDNKKILKQLLSDAVQKKISLNPEIIAERILK